MDVKNWNQSAELQQTLLTAHASEGTQWILGIKRLVDVLRTLG
jgi:hypothetical protein